MSLSLSFVGLAMGGGGRGNCMFEMGKYVSPSVRVCSLFALRSLGSWLRLTRSLSSTRRVRIALLCSRNAHALSRSASTRFRSCKAADRAIRDAAADAAFRQAGESTAGCSAGDIQGWHVADDDGWHALRIPNSWELTRRKVETKRPLRLFGWEVSSAWP